MSASASNASLFPLITYPQIQQYHEVTDSFAQRRPSILPVLNSFRTLSIATGGWYPFPPSSVPGKMSGQSHLTRDHSAKYTSRRRSIMNENTFVPQEFPAHVRHRNPVSNKLNAPSSTG